MINMTIKVDTRNLVSKLRTVTNKAISKKKKLLFADMQEQIKDTFRHTLNVIGGKEIARFAPSREDEKEILVSGIDDRGRKLGWPTDTSRFMKNPEFKYLRDAISEYARFSIKTVGGGNRFNLKLSLTRNSAEQINRSIGFAWLKKIGGRGLIKRRTTDAEAGAAWGYLLRLWEYGGSYTVTPRNPRGMLAPGPDKRTRTKSMTKTIPAYRMFKRGMRAARRKVMRAVKIKLQNRYMKT